MAAPSNVLAIRDLSTWLGRWRVRGRVIQKSDVSTFRRNDGRGDGRVGSVEIVDAQGDCISARFWDDAADKWLSRLQKGGVYEFANGRIGVRRRPSLRAEGGEKATADSPYELTFNVDAEIVPCDHASESIAQRRRAQHVSLRDIKNSPRDPPFTVDVCALVRRVAPAADPFVVRATGRQSFRRSISVVDDTQCEMEITVFGDLAESFPANVGDLIEFQMLQVRDFRGRRGATMRSTTVEVIADADASPQAARIRDFVEAKGGINNIDFEPLSNDVGEGGGSSAGALVNNDADALTLHELLSALEDAELVTSDISYSQPPQSGDAGNGNIIHTVIAAPCRLLYTTRTGEVSMVYPGCPRCSKKMTAGSDDDYRCDPCNFSSSQPSLRLMFGLLLADVSGSRMLARCFHQSARTILKLPYASGSDNESIRALLPTGCTASSLPKETLQLLEYDTLWRRYRFRLRARKELYNGEERQNISILQCDRLNFARDARTRLKPIIAAALVEDGSRKRGAATSDDASAAKRARSESASLPMPVGVTW